VKSSAIIGRVGTLAVVLGVGAAISGVTGIAQADNPKHNDRNSSASSDNRPGNSRAERRAARAAGSGQDKGADAGGNQESGQARASHTPKTKTTPSAAGDTDSTSPDPRPRLGERLRTITGSLTGSAPSTGAPKTTTRTVEESAPAAQPETRAPRPKVRDPFAGVQEAVANIPAVVAKTPAQLVDRSASGLGATPITRPDAADVPTRSNNRRSITDVAARLGAAATPAVTMATGRAADVPALSRAALAKAENTVDSQGSPFRGLSVFGEKQLSDTPAPVQAFVANASGTLANTSLPSVDVPGVKPGAAATLVSSLLVATGLSPLAGGGPGTPTQSPFAWALAAWTRKEADKDLEIDGVEVKSAKDGESVGTGAAPITASSNTAMRTMAVAQNQDSTPQVGETVTGPGQSKAPVLSGDMSSKQVGWTTGPNTNTMQNWYVGGTDLGITWVGGTDKNGNPVVYSIFGDTYNTGGAPNEGNGWRDNVLLRSNDLDLTNGIQYNDAVISPGGDYTKNAWWNPSRWKVTDNPDGNRAGATQIIPDTEIDRIDKTQGNNVKTFTLIPTAGLGGKAVIDETGQQAIDEDGNPVFRQYATVMSIKQWGQAGSWTTNWSAVAHSDDGGKTWTIDDSSVRPSTGGNANFQQNAMTYGKPGDPNSYVDGDTAGERYVYVYGTPSGRQGNAYLARVPENSIGDLDSYQYYAGDNKDGTGNWVVGKPDQAVAVITANGTNTSVFPETGIIGTILKPFVGLLKLVYPSGFKPGGIFSSSNGNGNVSEMSVQYNEYLGKYVVMYTDGGNNVVMRVSDTPEGAWSNAVVVQGNDGYLPNTSMYAPMIHPLSGTGQLAGGKQYLYYNLSQWNNTGNGSNDYNPRMMQTDLSKLKISYA